VGKKVVTVECSDDEEDAEEFRREEISRVLLSLAGRSHCEQRRFSYGSSSLTSGSRESNIEFVVVCTQSRQV